MVCPKVIRRATRACAAPETGVGVRVACRSWSCVVVMRAACRSCLRATRQSCRACDAIVMRGGRGKHAFAARGVGAGTERGREDENPLSTNFFTQTRTGQELPTIRSHIMPLTKKGRKIKRAMERSYGRKKGEGVFYASQRKGTIKGTHSRRKK